MWGICVGIDMWDLCGGRVVGAGGDGKVLPACRLIAHAIETAKTIGLRKCRNIYNPHV